MKKLIGLGIITVLIIGLSGCDWFQSTEPAVEQPTVTEESETTPVAEPYVYENTQYGFALTFPVNWGEVNDHENGERFLLIDSEDDTKSMTITIVDKGGLNDSNTAVFVGETENYDIYRESLQREIDILGTQEDVTEQETLEAEYKDIANTFKAL